MKTAIARLKKPVTAGHVVKDECFVTRKFTEIKFSECGVAVNYVVDGGDSREFPRGAASHFGCH